VSPNSLVPIQRSAEHVYIVFPRPKKIQDLVTDPKQDRRMASISEIPDAGHWVRYRNPRASFVTLIFRVSQVLQEKPDELSERIFKVLGSLGSNASTAKL
jgi:hypothetical protein